MKHLTFEPSVSHQPTFQVSKENVSLLEIEPLNRFKAFSVPIARLLLAVNSQVGQ